MSEFDEYGNYKMACAPGYDESQNTNTLLKVRDARIAFLEVKNAELRAEIERMRPVVEAAQVVEQMIPKSISRWLEGEALVKTVRNYESKDKP